MATDTGPPIHSPPPPPPPPPPRSLPPPFNTSPPSSFQLITQGAEALLYKTEFLTPTQSAALKVRPRKPWRHPTLDRRLTRQRILAEARVLVRCLREGVKVPQVYALDWEQGWMVSEWIEGPGTVKDVIRKWEAGENELKELLRRVGAAVGKLHDIGIVHGDLTTSNMMLRATSDNSQDEMEEVVLIDFGLAVQNATMEEDRAVDLYVLERAFGSTHPKEERLFDQVLKGYEGSFKGAKKTLKKLEDVRMRGRKKSMIG